MGCSKEPRLIIAPQKGEDPQAVASFCIKLAREYPIKDNEIYLLSLNAESDHEISNIVANCLGERCRKFEFNELWENGFPINSGDIVFTTRFHAHLIASSLGARGYAASVSIPYYDIKHGSLSSLNSGFDVIGMHDFHFQLSDKILDTTEPTLANRVNELRAIKLDIASKIYDNINLSEVPLGAAQQLIHDGEPMSLPC